jgi:hypothetical protein
MTWGSASNRKIGSHPFSIPARLTWKDASGAVRFTSVTTKDVTEEGAVVECDGAMAIPLYRLVHLQVEKSARDLDGVPVRLRQGRVLSAVWKVGPRKASTGTPSGYALRFLIAPPDQASAAVAVAS